MYICMCIYIHIYLHIYVYIYIFRVTFSLFQAMLINLVIFGQLYRPQKVSKTTGSHQPIINTFRQSTSFAIMAHHIGPNVSLYELQFLFKKNIEI